MEENLRYPIGPFQPADPISSSIRTAAIETLGVLPNRLRSAVRNLLDEHLGAPYRNGGWSIRQVVHHLADAHSIGFARFKHGLTEDRPEVKQYDENRWAELADTAGPIDSSLSLIDGVHERWSVLLAAMPEEQFARTVSHPSRGAVSLDYLVQLYAWHGRHHVAHITEWRKRLKI